MRRMFGGPSRRGVGEGGAAPASPSGAGARAVGGGSAAAESGAAPAAGAGAGAALGAPPAATVGVPVRATDPSDVISRTEPPSHSPCDGDREAIASRGPITPGNGPGMLNLR